jgi:hypothetical protein
MVTVMKQRFTKFTLFFFILNLIVFSSSGSTVSIVLENRAYEGDTNSSGTYNRTFIPQTKESFVLAATNATLAVFFDVLENVKLLK